MVINYAYISNSLSKSLGYKKKKKIEKEKCSM